MTEQTNTTTSTEKMTPTAWEVRDNQEVINVSGGSNVSIGSGANVMNCYVHGGKLVVRANGNVRNCIVNRGTLVIETGGEVGSLLIKEGASLQINSGVKLKHYRSTGPIYLSMFPKAELKS